MFNNDERFGHIHVLGTEELKQVVATLSINFIIHLGVCLHVYICVGMCRCEYMYPWKPEERAGNQYYVLWKSRKSSIIIEPPLWPL